MESEKWIKANELCLILNGCEDYWYLTREAVKNMSQFVYKTFEKDMMYSVFVYWEKLPTQEEKDTLKLLLDTLKLKFFKSSRTKMYQ